LVHQQFSFSSVPTRSTSYTHLRDAFVRALHARLDRKRKEGTYTDEIAMADSTAIGKLKSLFPNTPLAKHTPFDIYLPAPSDGLIRTIIFRDMGIIENEFVATDLLLHYFEDPSPSPPVSIHNFYGRIHGLTTHHSEAEDISLFAVGKNCEVDDRYILSPQQCM
jgi:hypothetical protein